MIKDCGIYPFFYEVKEENKKSGGSSLIRGEWLVKNWPEAEMFVNGREYKAVIFQKTYWAEYARLFPGLKILDVCDLEDGNQRNILKMANFCDLITTSTEAIAKYLKKRFSKPVVCIPDRLDLTFFKEQKKPFSGPLKTAVWHGYGQNFPMIAWAIPSLIKAGIHNLIVIANKNYNLSLFKTAQGKINIINIPWEKETINRELIKADVLVNPHYNKGSWRFKSNNKTLYAWAIGLPAAETEDDLLKLQDENYRYQETQKKTKVGF